MGRPIKILRDIRVAVSVGIAIGTRLQGAAGPNGSRQSRMVRYGAAVIFTKSM
jgi:hypothetical protein